MHVLPPPSLPPHATLEEPARRVSGRPATTVETVLTLVTALLGVGAGLFAAHAAHAAPPEATDVHRARATQYLEAGEPARAVHHLRLHLAARSDDVDARALLADTCERLGLRRSALEHASTVLAADAANERALLTLARIQLGDGLPDEALATLDRTTGPATEARRLLRARALLALGRPAQARVPLERLAATRPDDPEVHVLLGLAALRMGAPDDLEAAARAFEQAIELAPERAALHNDLGFALEKLGRLEEAFLAYLEAESLPDSRPGHERNRRRVEAALARR